MKSLLLSLPGLWLGDAVRYCVLAFSCPLCSHKHAHCPHVCVIPSQTDNPHTYFVANVVWPYFEVSVFTLALAAWLMRSARSTLSACDAVWFGGKVIRHSLNVT